MAHRLACNLAYMEMPAAVMPSGAKLIRVAEALTRRRQMALPCRIGRWDSLQELDPGNHPGGAPWSYLTAT